jgi:hypothetical protein
MTFINRVMLKITKKKCNLSFLVLIMEFEINGKIILDFL